MSNISTMAEKKAMSFDELTTIYDSLVKTINLLQDASEELNEAFEEISSKVLDLQEDLKNYEFKHAKRNCH